MNLHLCWDSNSLYNHVYMCNEEGDILNGAVIRYELLEEYFGESMNHVLNYSNQQLGDICYPLVCYLMDKMDFQEYKGYLEKNVIGKPTNKKSSTFWRNLRIENRHKK